MKHHRTLSMIFLLATLSACQSPRPWRTPSSIAESRDWEELRVLKQRKVVLASQSIEFQKRKDEIGLDKVETEAGEIDAKINVIEKRISALEEDSRQTINNMSSLWRVERERIELSDVGLYELDNNVELSVATYEAKETIVNLTHNFFSSGKYGSYRSDKPGVTVTMKCDADFESKYGLKVKKHKAMTQFSFILKDSKLANDYRELRFHPDMKTCNVRFKSNESNKSKEYGFKLVNETTKLKKLEPLLSTTEICTLKKGSDKFFETSEFTSMSCPMKYDSIKILPEPEDSIYARFEGLLGRKLPDDFLKNGNPYAELDFSKAPHFDAILVSYLVFRADFYGTLMARLLAYHADRGAQVRIVISDVIILDKDEAMFEKMMAKHPNMKMVKYKFDTKQDGGAWISEFHRTNHVKVFAAYSKENPEDSFVIMGGRNIHDGFAFKQPIDVSKFPEIVNYVTGDESWAYWRDFEMVVRGQEYAESVVRNYLNFYHIDKNKLIMKVSSVAVQKENVSESAEETLRYYVSIPFKDEPNLNLFYARMIDSAKKKILISSPYFRPVKEISDALDRAIKRGVDISIITRLDLEGDTADFILGAVNKDGVNHFLDKVKVYEYIEPKVILHSKLLMIDDEISFISSVNLNKRSFYHDLENGVVVNDRKFTVEMGNLYSEYLKITKQLTEQQKIKFWQKWFIKVFDKVF